MPLALAAIPLVASVGAGALGASAATAGIVGSAAGLAASTLAGNQGSSKAASVLQPNQIDIGALQSQAQAIAQQNAAASRALQNEYTPWVTTGQSQSNQSLQSQLTPNAGTAASSAYLNSTLTNPLNSSLINQAAGVAGSQLSLGGQLDQGTQNAVTRQALAVAGQATPGGLGQGADVTARDLGLTSMQLLNQRLQNASSIGQQQLGASQANQNAVLSRIAALQGITQNQFGNTLAASNMYNNIQAPNSGLNPGSIANLAVGNANSMNQYQTSLANIYGQQGQNTAKTIGTLAGNANLGQFGSSVGSGIGNLFGGSGVQSTITNPSNYSFSGTSQPLASGLLFSNPGP
jgi:hypothetical protein